MRCSIKLPIFFIIIFLISFSKVSAQLFVYGHQEGSKFGTDVGISADGNTLVVGVPQYDGLPNDITCELDPNCDNGRAIVYTQINAEWVPLGNPIIGEEPESRCGQSVDISGDGQVIIVGEPRDNQGAGDFDEGQVRVFEYDAIAQDWVQRGLPFNGLYMNHNLGHSVAISDDGNTIIIGGPYQDNADVGSAEVHRWDGLTWQSYPPILGSVFYEYFGSSVDISDDGNYVIVGGYGYDDQRGRAYVYDVSTTGLAVPMGTFDGDNFDILFGYGVSIDGDGDRIAVTASYGTVDFSLYEGTAYIYEYDSLSLGWSQLGQTIVGTEETNGFDQIAISNDGNVIAVSASSAYNDQGVRSGRVYFYEFDGGSWIPMSQEYQGQEHLEQFGQQIDMSKDAQYIAIGAPLKNVPTNNEGAVAVGTLFPQNLYLSGNPTLTGSYYAISTIYAQSNIPTGNQVKLTARDSIFLQFPFVIDVGAVLEAVIFP